LKIFSCAPSDNKYAKKIPKDLIHLRKSLDMVAKVEKINPEHNEIKTIPQINLEKF